VRHDSLWGVYHVELRQFPHNLCRFNLAAEELRAIVDRWARGEWIELGERKWNRHQAKLTILEGPQLPMEQLSMGRGWRAAQRQSEDVTARVIAAASEALGATAAGTPALSPAGPSAPAPTSPPGEPSAARAPGSSADGALLVDPLALGVQLASLLGDDPARLLVAWRQAAVEKPALSPSETLALAEEVLRSSRRGPG